MTLTFNLLTQYLLVVVILWFTITVPSLVILISAVLVFLSCRQTESHTHTHTHLQMWMIVLIPWLPSAWVKKDKGAIFLQILGRVLCLVSTVTYRMYRPYVTFVPLPLFHCAVPFVPLPLMAYGRTAKNRNRSCCNGTAATADISNGTTEFFYVGYVVFTVDT